MSFHRGHTFLNHCRSLFHMFYGPEINNNNNNNNNSNNNNNNRSDFTKLIQGEPFSLAMGYNH